MSRTAVGLAVEILANNKHQKIGYLAAQFVFATGLFVSQAQDFIDRKVTARPMAYHVVVQLLK